MCAHAASPVVENRIPPSWRTAEAQYGCLVTGMLGIDERKLLFHLARDHVDGSGVVVDLGAFCGASACCLAEGLNDNPRGAGVSIHSYDHFIADDGYLVDFIRNYMAAEIVLGESFEPIFRSATSPFADRITAHVGDLALKRWRREDGIEILFVDAAKTLDLSGHIVREFFPALRPSHSVVIQQDFYHPGTYYLVVLMDFLRPWMSMIEPRRDWSSAYILSDIIPQAALDKAANYAFSYAEERAAIERSIDEMGDEGQYLQCSLAALVGRHEGRQLFEVQATKIRPPATDSGDVIWPAQQQWLANFDPRRIRGRTNWVD